MKYKSPKWTLERLLWPESIQCWCIGHTWEYGSTLVRLCERCNHIQYEEHIANSGHSIEKIIGYIDSIKID